MTQTKQTDSLEESDFHKYDADEVPLSVYKRMTEHARDLERAIIEARIYFLKQGS